MGFWRQKNVTCDNEICIFWFYLIKRKICNLAEINPLNPNIYIILGVVKWCPSAVHIFVLLLKQNICAYHNPFSYGGIFTPYIVFISHFGHGFKTLHKNMQMWDIKGNLIFAYVNRLNLFHPICTTPRWNCQTTQRHVLNARCATIRVREKAVFCNIIIPTSIKSNSRHQKITRARVVKHLSCGRLSTITRRRAKWRQP